MDMAKKYLADADQLISKGDYLQASEKLWGASAEIVKVLAAKKGVSLKTHGEIWDFVIGIDTELKDPEITTLFLVANQLHQNFYEGDLPPQAVARGGEAVKRFISKLEALL